MVGVSEIVVKTLSFVYNTTIKLLNELSQLTLQKEIDTKIKQVIIHKSITEGRDCMETHYIRCLCKHIWYTWIHIAFICLYCI